MITPERVRELLLAVWGRQACRRPEHWPATLERLLKDGVCANPGNARASFEPRVEAAVSQLTAAYTAGIPTGGPDLVWRCLPMLDRDQRIELAALLASEARTAAVETAPDPAPDPVALIAAAHGA